jgi:hypothetical protein
MVPRKNQEGAAPGSATGPGGAAILLIIIRLQEALRPIPSDRFRLPKVIHIEANDSDRIGALQLGQSSASLGTFGWEGCCHLQESACLPKLELSSPFPQFCDSPL